MNDRDNFNDRLLDYSGEKGRRPSVDMAVRMSYQGQVVCREKGWYFPPDNAVGIVTAFPHNGVAKVRWEIDGFPEHLYGVGLHGQYMLCEVPEILEHEMIDVASAVLEENDETRERQPDFWWQNCRRARLHGLAGSDGLNGRICRVVSMNTVQDRVQVVLEDPTRPGICNVHRTVRLSNVNFNDPYCLGISYFEENRFQDAIRELCLAKAQAEREGDSCASIAASQYLVACYSELGDFPHAIEHGRVILQRAVATADWRAACMASLNLSDPLRRLGDAASAARANEEAIGYARACGDAEAEGKAEYNLALLHEEAVEWELALDRYGRSLATAARFNDAAGAALTHARMRFVHAVLAYRLSAAGPAFAGSGAQPRRCGAGG